MCNQLTLFYYLQDELSKTKTKKRPFTPSKGTLIDNSKDIGIIRITSTL